MRFLHFLLFALVAVTVISAPQETAPSVQCSVHPCDLPPVYEGNCEHPLWIGWGFSAELERKCISRTGSSAARDGGRLQLKFRDGTARTYQDKPYRGNDEGCDSGDVVGCRDYELHDYFLQHELFLLRVTCWESEEWHLVRQSNGGEELIVAPPRYSPDRKWLAAVHWSEGPIGPCGPDDNGNNGIDIVPSASDPAIKPFHYRTKGYALFDFDHWDGNERLLTNVTMRLDPAAEFTTFPVEVVRENGAWRLKWPLSTLPP
jgi:hypothetical protein